MALAIKPEQARMRLETLLREAIAALAALDAERIEELASLVESAGFAGSAEAVESTDRPVPVGLVEWPQSAAEWRRADAAHCVLGHLVDATGRQLSVQRRIAGPAERFRDYRREANARRAERWSMALALPWGGESRRGS